MAKHRRIVALGILAVFTVSLMSGVFYVKGQIQETSAELIKLAEGANLQVKSLIDLIFANETALQAINKSSRLDELSKNVTRYTDGAEKLAEAKNQLESSKYAEATTLANQALSMFREPFKSIKRILKDSGLQNDMSVDAQGLVDAYIRALAQISQLRAILQTNGSDAFGLLDQAETHLNINAAKGMLLKNNVDQVVSNLSQANQPIAQVYQYVKMQAEESNDWRIRNYCAKIQEQVTERRQYCNQQ